MDNLINFTGIFVNIVTVLDNFSGGKKINNGLVVTFRIEWMVSGDNFPELSVFIKFLTVSIVLDHIHI